MDIYNARFKDIDKNWVFKDEMVFKEIVCQKMNRIKKKASETEIEKSNEEYLQDMLEQDAQDFKEILSKFLLFQDFNIESSSYKEELVQKILKKFLLQYKDNDKKIQEKISKQFKARKNEKNKVKTKAHKNKNSENDGEVLVNPNFVEENEKFNMEKCKKTIMNIGYFFMDSRTTIRLLICVGDIFINEKIMKKEQAKSFYKSAVEIFLKEPVNMRWFLSYFKNIIENVKKVDQNYKFCSEISLAVFEMDDWNLNNKSILIQELKTETYKSVFMQCWVILQRLFQFDKGIL